MSSDLTSISTQGWYTSASVVDELVPISTFGWYFDIEAIIQNPDILSFLLQMNQVLNIQLSR